MELNATVDMLLEFPQAAPVVAGSKDVRRMVMQRFPYVIIYKLTDGLLLIGAVAHTSRKPGYWKDRF